MSVPDSGRERRRYRRYPAAKLKASMKTKKLMMTQWQDVAVGDFSSHGMAIFVENAVKPESQITLNLVLEMDMGSIQIDKINATVMNITDNKSYWRLGLSFNPEFVEKNSDVNRKLEKIARILEQSAQLKDRLKDQITER